MPSVAVEMIRETTSRALERHGASSATAAIVADAVAVAEARGNRICGLYYVESYCVQLESGRVDGRAEPTVSTPRAGVVQVDAAGGFAQPAFEAAFEATCASARTNGVVGLSISRSHTATALGWFTEQFARAGLIALATTNAPARVAPPGGSRRLLGTNPIALAVPDGTGGVGLSFDFSTSATALGRITMAAAAGEPIPLGWAVDADGQPTTDAAAAVEGSLLSTGGHKGFGIGLMVELFAAGLTGSRSSLEAPPLKAPTGEPHEVGVFVLVIDPEGFDGERFARLVDELDAAVASDGSARLPGAAQHRLAEVEVDDATWNRIVELAGA